VGHAQYSVQYSVLSTEYRHKSPLRCRLDQAAEQILELLAIDGLGEMEVEARLLRLAAILVATVAGQGHEVGGGERRLLPYGAGDVVTAHAAGKADIAENDIRAE